MLLTRLIQAGCVLAAYSLVGVHISRLGEASAILHWYLPLVLAAAWVASDLASGIVHWTADSWGSQQTPIVGPRFLRPFRVHHINPEDILRRGFVGLNGDVAIVTLPILLAAFAIPLTGFGSLAALFIVSMSAVGLPTNQVHQWAHMPQPPKFVAWLQRKGFILSREEHVEHHTSPYAMNYCITNGWCNRALTKIDFFRRMEWIITRLTGAVPRAHELVMTLSEAEPRLVPEDLSSLDASERMIA